MMVSIEEKLIVLSKMAQEFNRHKLTWAVGASLLLYLKGYTDCFHDIDIMVADADAAEMESILNTMGSLQPSTKGSYETKHFREFVVDFVDVDMIGGFAIVSNGKVYDCDLEQSQITEYAEIHGQRIPLHSVALWRKYYALMGRDKKVALIDQIGT